MGSARGNNPQHELISFAITGLIGATSRAYRMLEVYAEPNDCLGDVAMARWKRTSSVTSHGNNSQHEMIILATTRLIGTCLRACRMLEVYAEPKDCLEDVAMAHYKRPHLLLRTATIHSTDFFLQQLD